MPKIRFYGYVQLFIIQSVAELHFAISTINKCSRMRMIYMYMDKFIEKNKSRLNVLVYILYVRVRVCCPSFTATVDANSWKKCFVYTTLTSPINILNFDNGVFELNLISGLTYT